MHNVSCPVFLSTVRYTRKHTNTHTPLQWRPNERDGVSNHQPHDCLLRRLFKRRSKKTLKPPCHWPLCEFNISPEKRCLWENDISLTCDAELSCFPWSASWINGWVNNREAGDLRRHRAHYDVIVMFPLHFSMVTLPWGQWNKPYCNHISKIMFREIYIKQTQWLISNHDRDPQNIL